MHIVLNNVFQFTKRKRRPPADTATGLPAPSLAVAALLQHLAVAATRYIMAVGDKAASLRRPWC